VSELLREMYRGMYLNPFNPRELVLYDETGDPVAGVTLVHLSPTSWGPGHIYLESIRAMKKGGGRELMEILVDRADQYGVTITGDVKPLKSQVYGMKKMPLKKLKDWYRQFGFQMKRGDEMLRLPMEAP
jgi:hypothetical protein